MFRVHKISKRLILSAADVKVAMINVADHLPGGPDLKIMRKIEFSKIVNESCAKMFLQETFKRAALSHYGCFAERD